MIISKTPFRISLFGGSTDYKSFYSQYGSLLIGFTINKYCYINIRQTPNIFAHQTKISYSQVETVSNNQDIQHNGVRGVFQYLGKMNNDRYELQHLSDLPAQTGTGSSSSFVVGLLNCLMNSPTKRELATGAIEVERVLLSEPGGIQDQIWAAYGGMNSIEINNEGYFKVKPLAVNDEFISEFFNRSILIYTGKERQSFKIAKSHDSISAESNKIKIMQLAYEAYKLFESENITKIASLLHDSWEQKKKISSLISNKKVNDLYESLQNDGMIGGKLLGTGGSGFIFGILQEGVKKDTIKNQYKHYYVDVGLSRQGSEIINE